MMRLDCYTLVEEQLYAVSDDVNLILADFSEWLVRHAWVLEYGQ